MEDLDDINNEIKRMKASERARLWNSKNKERMKNNADIWNKKYRKDYQRAYRMRKKNE